MVEPRTGGSRVSIAMTVWLVLVWVAAIGSVTPLSLVGALLLSVLIQVAFPLPHRSGHFRFHPLSLAWLMIRYVWDVARAGVHVAWLILSPRSQSRSRQDSILRCPVRTDNPEYLTILSAMTSLIPGTIVIRVDRPRRLVYLHCLDVEGQGGADAIRRATRDQEERILRAVAPRPVQRSLGIGRVSKGGDSL